MGSIAHAATTEGKLVMGDANGCEITAYDKLDGVWKDPSRVGMS